MSESVAVEVYGRIYHLRTNADKSYVVDLADMIHKKMLEVERSTKTVDTVRVAVLAALNLADEYCILKQESERRSEEYKQEQAKLLQLVDDALKDGDPLPDA